MFMKARRDFKWYLIEIAVKLIESWNMGKVYDPFFLAPDSWWHEGDIVIFVDTGFFLTNKAWSRILKWEEAVYFWCHWEKDTSAGNR